ncbi:unnamed protein product [Acanthoscelides obtectus]|uniref:Kinesin-like protein n=1 Tax=Acanthoscelides obtectus TaxID=200917 RepID=A0A9P0PLD7_ACAOB|nr:unnamed protein product [Acanthoscelides obtectus]CAK1624544.1 Kinesin-like protein Klp61F [Acanthoscelides obtectus]
MATLKKKGISSSLQHISMQNIKVVVRVRPITHNEEEQNVKNIVKCLTHKEILMKEKKYSFDRVFKPTASQIELYINVVAPLIKDVISGYNCTVFAYGQTGTGKTYTMTGDKCSIIKNWKEDEDAGIIPRAAHHLFHELDRMKINQYTIKVSYIELYNEEIRDLLSNDENALQLYNDSKGLKINGLNEVTCFNSADVCRELQRGILKRQVAPTLMNHQSSRSHTVFTISLSTTESNLAGEDILKYGKINLVDLAGSENIAKAGCKDLRAQELANINKSLLTLGRVIQSLADKNQKHIPYRDSKLTRILQDSLGGNTKTVIIATVSPAHTSHEETANTLEYAMRARDIKNTPVANEQTSKNQLIEELVKDIEVLQRDLDAAREGTGFYVDRVNYQRIVDAVYAVTGEEFTHDEIAERKAQRISKLEKAMHDRIQEFEKTVKQCKEQREELKRIKTEVKEKEYLANWYEQYSTATCEEIQNLLDTTQTLNNEKEILLGKLENMFKANESHVTIARQSATAVLSMVDRNTAEKDKTLNAMVEAGIRAKEKARESRSIVQPFILSMKNTANILVTMSVNTDAVQNVQECVCKKIDIVRKRFEILEKMGEETLTAIPVLMEQHKQRTEEFLEASIKYCMRQQNQVVSYNEKCISYLNILEEESRERIRTNEGCIKNLLYQIKILQDTSEQEKLKIARFQDWKSQISDDKSIHKKHIEFAVSKLRQMAQKAVRDLEETVHSTFNNHDKRNEALQTSMSAISELGEEILTVTRNLDLENKRKFGEIDNVIKTGILQSCNEIEDVLNQHISDTIQEVDTLIDITSSFDDTYRKFVEDVKDTITKQVLEKSVPPKHAGDTPIRKELRIPSIDPTAPREILLEKFKVSLPETIEVKDVLPNQRTE